MTNVYKFIYRSIWIIVFILAISSIVFTAMSSKYGFDIYNLINIILFYTVVIVFSSYRPLLAAKSGKLTNITEGKLYHLLEKAFILCNIKNPKFNLYISTRSNSSKQIANAGVQGFFNYSIIIDQATIDLLNEEELLAILYHEIGHIIGKDDLYKTLSLLGIVFIPSLSYVIFRSLMLQKLLLNILAIITSIIIILGLLFILHLFRDREYKSDLFACQKGNPKALANALIKISLSNNEPLRTSMFRELFSTHPNTYKRLYRIEKYRE